MEPSQEEGSAYLLKNTAEREAARVSYLGEVARRMPIPPELA